MSKIRLFGCSWRRISCSYAKRFAVSTGAQEVYKNPQQRHALIFLVQGELKNLFGKLLEQFGSILVHCDHRSYVGSNGC